MTDQATHTNMINATVIIRHGANAEVEDQQGHRYHCALRRRHQSLVVGDEVLCQIDSNDSGIIVNQLDRQSTLMRQNRQGEQKTVAANIDRLFIVIAAEPPYQAILIDQYLVAATLSAIRPMIIFNKEELLSTTALTKIKQSLAIYEKIGITVSFVSCQQRIGLETLRDQLANHRSVLVGQSGVGKSSLIASLLPQQTIKIGNISIQGHGRHTTSQAQLYHLANGGEIIDSPGVREFGLSTLSLQQLSEGFVEFKPYRQNCQFRNCRHQQEPGCAIKQAVEQGKIAAQRLQNFHQLMRQYLGNEHE